jgi:alkylation response protein AidB-like acyl-CoA dehydrogenase
MAYDLSLTEEQNALVELARDFTKKEIVPKAAHMDETGEFPFEICNKARELGLMNIEVGEAYGGVGLGCLEHTLVLEEIAYGCAGVNTSMSANMLGAMPIIIAGTEEQKTKYLGRLINEPIFAAYCCSEPDAGSDVAGLSTRVEKHGDDYVLNGQKRWITNGGVANFYTVLATFDKKQKHKGIGCFIVDANAPGVKAGRKEDKLGQRCSNTTDVIFEDVKIPKSALLGAENEGFKIAMKTFDRSRPWIASVGGRAHPSRARGVARVRARAEDVRRAHRAAPGHPVHARGHRGELRSDAPSVHEGRVDGRPGSPGQHRERVREALRRGLRDEGRDGRGADLRRLRLHEGVPRREAHARREAPPDLRGHLPDPARRHRKEPPRPRLTRNVVVPPFHGPQRQPVPGGAVAKTRVAT